jgi:hypothetical protein
MVALGRTSMKRVRGFLESIAFARLKPQVPTPPKPLSKRLGPLGDPVERLLSGGPVPADPLYLSNRTLGQKLKFWSFVGIPCAVLAMGIGVMLSDVLDPPKATPPKEPTAAEINAGLLPNLVKDLKLAPPSVVQVLEVRVEGSRLAGEVNNTTTREIAAVELVVDLTNAAGSHVGAVRVTVEKLPPSGRKEFQVPLDVGAAAFAIVREIALR